MNVGLVPGYGIPGKAGNSSESYYMYMYKPTMESSFFALIYMFDIGILICSGLINPGSLRFQFIHSYIV